MLTLVQAEAQFDQFVSFAEKAMKEGNTKSIARSGGSVEAMPVVRSIASTSDDKVYALRRSAANKAANDATRTMFRQSIAQIFGGEANIPEPVLKVMNLKDFDAGKPLTARRIMAINEAVRIEQPKIAGATVLISNAIASLNAETMRRSIGTNGSSSPAGAQILLSADQKRLAAILFLRYAEKYGLDRKNEQLLAANIVRIISNPKLASQADHYADRIARDIASFRDFELGDSCAKELDEAARNYMDGELKRYCRSDDLVDADGINKGFTQDLSRSHVTIAKHKFAPVKDGSSSGRITDDFKRAVPNPLHRRVLSGFMTQVSSNIATSLIFRSPAPATDGYPNGMPLHTVKGAEMVVGHPYPVDDEFYSMTPCNFDGKSSYRLSVAPDGITYIVGGTLLYGVKDAGTGEASASTGTFTITQEYSFDLSGDEPKLTSYHLGQTFDS